MQQLVRCTPLISDRDSLKTTHMPGVVKFRGCYLKDAAGEN